MMKLTVTFLAALAAADAAEARSHRQARRQYGERPANSKPAVYSSVPSVPYNPTTAEVFATSVPVAVTYPPKGEPTPAASSAYGSGFSEGPYHSDKVPSESVAYPPVGDKPSHVAYPPTGESTKVPEGVAYPTGSYGDKPVKDTSSVPAGVYPPTGYPAYPTGTGSYGSATPLSDYVTKTIYNSGTPVGTTICKESETPTVEYETSKIPITHTLIYTVGTGSTAHAVTTEVTSTSTKTLTKTVVITQHKPKPTPETPYKDSYPSGGEEYGTKTIKSTTTSTKYITVHATPSNKVPSKEQTYPTGPAKGDECAAPVTVTVTAKQTVTVTKGSHKPSHTPSSDKPQPPSNEYPPAKPSPSKPVGEEYPPYQPTKPSATPSAKYPVGNGTHPYPAGPTGFKTSAKPYYPTGSYGTGVPNKPSETSLPYFSFVSDTPYPAETPKTPSEEQTYPTKTPSEEQTYPSKTPVAEASYGNGYGEVPAETPKVPSEENKPKPTPSTVYYGSGY